MDLKNYGKKRNVPLDIPFLTTASMASVAKVKARITITELTADMNDAVKK